MKLKWIFALVTVICGFLVMADVHLGGVDILVWAGLGLIAAGVGLVLDGER